jgi:hypothetical protein
MTMALFVVAAVAAGIVQGFLFPPGPWGFGGEGYWTAYFFNWNLNLLLTLLLFFLFVHRRPDPAQKKSRLAKAIVVLATSSTIPIAGSLFLLMDSKISAGLATVLWILLWCYGYVVLEYLRRLFRTLKHDMNPPDDTPPVKRDIDWTPERDEYMRLAVLFVTLTFNSFSFFVSFGVRGGAIAGYWLVLGAELAVTLLVVAVATLFGPYHTT